MPQDLYILAILDGLSYAALLFLVALGMTLVFGVMNIVNMAHGSFYALGGYMAATLGLWATSQGLSPAWSLLILPLAAVIIGVVFGGLMETSLIIGPKYTSFLLKRSGSNCVVCRGLPVIFQHSNDVVKKNKSLISYC